MEETDRERVGIRLDVLQDIVSELDGNAELQRMFGSPVSRSLFAVAEDGDFRIEEAGVVDLSEGEAEKFLHILHGVIKEKTR